ncbi:MAG: hypothetical protein GY814_16920 [Gammaproteobacteria bacterium]|nr:hypothetical protein [Gammaproteobacteria bacterium]
MPEGALLNDEQINKIEGLTRVKDADIEKFLAFFKVESIEEMREADFNRAVTMLNQKEDKQ